MSINKKKKSSATLQLNIARSLALNITKQRNKSNFKIGVATKVRGVVVCNNCRKPRCIYSLSAVSHMKPLLRPSSSNDTSTKCPVATYREVQEYVAMAKGRLNDAIDSPIFIRGMPPLDPDDPCYDIFLCDTTLDYETHLEPDFYVSRIEPTRLELLSLCRCRQISYRIEHFP